MRSRVQALLDEGKNVPDIARETGIRADTLRKAIHAGRLVKKKR
jgi:transposase-like protein